MSINRVQGLEAVLDRLNSTVSEIEGASITGLLEAGLTVQRTAQKRAPVDVGNLRASAYTRKGQNNKNAVEVGFTAAYAAAVHEKPMVNKGAERTGGSGKGTLWAGDGQPKFLESAFRDHERDIIDIVRKHARLKP